MSEISKYEAYKKKLQGVCDENNLVFRFRRDVYPITLTIRPLTGLGEQLSMLADAEENGYTSPDAAIVFAFKDGNVTYKTSQTFTISEALFNKIKNLFKNMHYCWLQYFFRDIIEKKSLRPECMPVIDEDDADDSDTPPDGMEQMEVCQTEDGEVPDIDGDDSYPTMDADDPKIMEATRIIRAENKASTSLLQRRMNIGYAEAARIIDSLEELGIVGPYTGSSPREVLPYDVPDDSDGEVCGNE